MFVCWQGHLACADYYDGPCNQIVCTCELTGVCMSCPPRREHTGLLRRIP